MVVSVLFAAIQVKPQTYEPQVRVEALNNSVPVIPLEHIKQWLESSTILPADSITNTPYIVGTADQRVLAGKRPDYLCTRTRLN